MRVLGSLVVAAECHFRFRLGLPATQPALDVGSVTLTPDYDDGRTRLCSDGPSGPAQLVIANSASYLFRQWPYFVNRVLYARSVQLRTFVWLGELPLHLAQTVGSVCRSSKHGRDLKSVYYERPESWINSNHYNKVVASLLVLKEAPAVFYLDLDAYYPKPSFGSNPYPKYDVEFASHNTDIFWLVKGGRFYASSSAFAKTLLETWLEYRCGFKDQWSLWHSILSMAKDCIGYRDELLNFTAYEAMKRRLPRISIDEVHQKCPDFKFNAVKMKGPPIHRSVYPDDVLTFEYMHDGHRRPFNVTNLFISFADLGLDTLDPTSWY